MSWISCRKSAARPEPRSTQEPRGLAPFSRLFRSSASVDHQMTPALFRPLSRAYALSRPSLADWLSGTPSAALRPKVSGLSQVRQRVIFLRKKRRRPRQGATGAGRLSPRGASTLPFLAPFSLHAQRLRATFPFSCGYPSEQLPRPSRLRLCSTLRAIEALLPETKQCASRALMQAYLNG